MKHPDLKVEVSKDKMSKRPRTLRLGNVMLDSFASYIADTPKEFSWAPEMSFFKISSKPWVNSKQSISTVSFKELECFGNTHCMWDFHKQMDMVWLDAEFIDSKVVSICNFSKNLFTRDPYFLKLERIPSILGFPHKVESILSYRMLEMFDFHFLSSCAKFKNTAHAIVNGFGACADSGAHTLYSIQNLRNGGLGIPSAEAQGILCM